MLARMSSIDEWLGLPTVCRRRRTAGFVWLFVLATVFPALCISAEQAVVPPLVGEHPQIAAQLIRLAGLKYRSGVCYIAPEHWRDDLHSRRIAIQTPQPGTRLKKGTDVVVWTLKRADDGVEKVTIPDFRGTPSSAALQTAEALGLNVMTIDSQPATETLCVIGQFPAPGLTTFKGSSILLRLSRRE